MRCTELPKALQGQGGSSWLNSFQVMASLLLTSGLRCDVIRVLSLVIGRVVEAIKNAFFRK